MKGDTKLTITLVVLIILAVAGYFAYKYFIPRINSVLPTTGASSNPNQAAGPVTGLPQITEPKAGSTIKSPIKVRGIVPPGWMFEGVFPIKIVDANQKLIVQGQAQEELPGSWQSEYPVYFASTLTFSTTAKSGFIVLQNDNASGNPANDKTYEIPVNF